MSIECVTTDKQNRMSDSTTSYTGSVKISSLSTTNSADLYYYDNCILNIKLNEDIFTSTSTNNITNLNVAYYALKDNINDIGRIFHTHNI